MSYPALVVLVPLAWLAIDKLIDWAYARQDKQTVEWPGRTIAGGLPREIAGWVPVPDD